MDIIQYNAMHKFVRVLDKPPAEPSVNAIHVSVTRTTNYNKNDLAIAIPIDLNRNTITPENLLEGD